MGITFLCTTPSISNRRNRWVNILAEMPDMSLFSSVNRRALLLRYQITFGVQAPPITLRHSVSGHLSGGSETVFLRRESMILFTLTGYQMETT